MTHPSSVSNWLTPKYILRARAIHGGTWIIGQRNSHGAKRKFPEKGRVLYAHTYGNPAYTGESETESAIEV